MTIPEYYTTHFAQYHEKTFHIDPATFLSSFAENLKPGALVHLPHTQMEPTLKNILQALKTGSEGIVYLSLKEGNDIYTDDHNRTFYLWQDPDIRALCNRLGLRVIDFFRSSSALGTGDAWLGYVLKRGV